MATERPETAGMGTTFVGAAVVDNELNIEWVGDSRAYLIRKQEAYCITKDHTKVQSMIDSGELSSQQARVHPDRNVITRSIGRREEVLIDTMKIPVMPDDTLLLCSDGLTGILEDNEIYRIVRESPSPQAACNQLVDACLLAGASDNVTVIVAVL
jgi:protein phosphatase